MQGARWQTNNFLNFLTSSSNYSEFQFIIRIMGITSTIEKKHTQKQTIKQKNKQKDQQYTTSLVIKWLLYWNPCNHCINFFKYQRALVCRICICVFKSLLNTFFIVLLSVIVWIYQHWKFSVYKLIKLFIFYLF